jgi:ribosome-binding protein aMBF1 (putative translation factor)
MKCERCDKPGAGAIFLVTSESLRLSVCYDCGLFAWELSCRVPDDAPGKLKMEWLGEKA